MSDKHSAPEETLYRPGMTRRESLKWMGLLAASVALPGLGGCEDAAKKAAGKTVDAAGHWPDLNLSPITGEGYGKDPNLIVPPEFPWPRTLTPAQLTQVAVLSDILLPRDGSAPAASEVGVPEVIDEWVSAPYENQQGDRLTILSALAWIDDEAALRFDKKFLALNRERQLAIVDDIAYDNDQTPAQFKRIAGAFDRFRQLVIAAFFCSPAGVKEIGYMGNVPIAGDYPGPTTEAMEHLETALGELGLSEFAYSEAL